MAWVADRQVRALLYASLAVSYFGGQPVDKEYPSIKSRVPKDTKNFRNLLIYLPTYLLANMDRVKDV